jgi:hypothetical protein
LSPASFDPHVPRGQHYPVGMVQWVVSLVLDCAASMRCAAAVTGLLGQMTGGFEAVPHWSTGRLWLLRIGLAELTRPKPIADDRVWMIDHSIQVGQVKCLVILGIGLGELPICRPLAHRDMELIDLVPMVEANKHSVAACLEAAAAEAGVPRAILDDHGADLHGGVEIFRAAHPRVVEIYDIKHKAACLLKALLERDPLWKPFAAAAAAAKGAMQQTELAALVPQSQRSKCRFMNLAGLVDWAVATLALLDDPAQLARAGISWDRASAKLGWLAGYRASLAGWSACHDLIGVTLEAVRDRGLYAQAGPDLAAALPAAEGQAGELRGRLIEFVTAESSQVRPGEWLPGSTEVLESLFGKLKSLERDQSKSGFTGLVLSLGAMVARLTPEAIAESLDRVRVRDVRGWCAKKLGVTVQSLRMQLYSPPGRNKTGMSGQPVQD